MEFAWNTQKNKMTDVKGKEYEQDRKGHVSNPDIDPEKTHLNLDFVESDLNLYQRIKKRVEEVRPVSRVQKNSVVSYSNIITVNSNQASVWGTEGSTEYLKEVYNYFCDEFGAENVVSAKVHLDETTPHMHLHFVPVNKENGKLQARIVMDRNRVNKVHTEASKYLVSKGFDVVRGSGKTKENVDIHKFKVEALKNDYIALENKIKSKTKELEKYDSALETKTQLESVYVEQGGLFNKGKVLLDKEDFELIKAKAVKAEEIKLKHENLIDFMKKVQKVELESIREKKRLKDRNYALRKQVVDLEKEVKLLKEYRDELSFLEEINPDIKREIKKAILEKKRIEEKERACEYQKSYGGGMSM